MVASASEAIANYQPRTLSPLAAAFARDLVVTAAPTTVARAKALLFAAGRLAAFCEERGLPLGPTSALADSVIERFVATGCAGASVATRRTLRANLRALGRVHRPPTAAVPGLPRDRAKVPYSAVEIAAFLALADAQPVVARRHRLAGLICLGAGAGLMGRELRHVTGRDVVQRAGGLLVEVGGPRPRVVPVRAEFHERLVAAVAVLGEGAYLIGGQQPDRRNVTSRLVGAAAGGIDLPHLDTGRLRATWLSTCAEAIGLKALLDAAGMSCAQRLGDVTHAFSSPGEAEMVRLLSGRRN